jgi:hypothetical protein
MRLTVRILIGFLICYTALAQPGIPACWLEAHPCQIHIHFSHEQAAHPHSHDYLFDMAKADSPALPVLLIPISLLIELLFLIQIFQNTGIPTFNMRGWILLPEPPPPRFSPLS